MFVDDDRSSHRRHGHPRRRPRPHDRSTTSRSTPFIGGQRHRHSSPTQRHCEMPGSTGVGGHDQGITTTTRSERHPEPVVVGRHPNRGQTVLERVVENVTRPGRNRIAAFRRCRSGHHPLRRRRPQEGDPSTRPPPGGPLGEVEELGARTHAAQLGESDEPDPRLGFDVECGHPTRNPPPTERHANHRADRDSITSAVPIP